MNVHIFKGYNKANHREGTSRSLSLQRNKQDRNSHSGTQTICSQLLDELFQQLSHLPSSSLDPEMDYRAGGGWAEEEEKLSRRGNIFQVSVITEGIHTHWPIDMVSGSLMAQFGFKKRWQQLRLHGVFYLVWAILPPLRTVVHRCSSIQVNTQSGQVHSH